MNKKWDNTGIANNVEMWKEVLRILKPGGHLLSFSSPRTYHRMTCAIEDAGFEIRDQIMWCFGSGFPKSQNVSKALDKMAGAEREDITNAAKQWVGWDSSLKPAFEPICVARKSLIGTIAQNVLEFGTGAINIE
jgi:site-specific DNA-methyltransferase (adenine-specific)